MKSNQKWKFIKSQIKNLLDETNSSQIYKVNMILCILEDYKKRYLNNKGEKNDTI